jgi:nitroimidazol reductase NimA-like FMN-containing flavoprotein (pyridoxamine 5'-phosphate oxidase superfamily)
MIYVNEGLVIYMVTAGNSEKLRQIKNNPNVSVIIIKSLSEASDTQEVIVSGRAEEVKSDHERERIYGLFKEKPPTYQEWIGKESRYAVMKITPAKVKYFDYSTGESKPRILVF